VGLIDLKKVFDGYWKTKQADSQLKERAGDLDKARKGMIDDYQKATEEYKKQLEAASDQALSPDERDKRKSVAEKKLLEIREIEQSINQFDQTSQRTLGEQQRRMRDKVLEDIKGVLNERARAAGYALVLDSAAETRNQTPVVMFTNGENDITDIILNELNSKAPVAIPSAGDTKDGTKPAGPSINISPDAGLEAPKPAQPAQPAPAKK
jgi:outer membrane protein